MKRITRLSYIANNRIPGEKAHSIYVLKMCEAFVSNGIDVELVVPFRFYNRRQNRNSNEILNIGNKFIIRRILSPDFIPLGKILGKLLTPLYFFQSLVFALFATLRAAILIHRSFYITCDIWVAYFFSFALPFRTSLDIHVLPESRIRKYILKRMIAGGMPVIVVTSKMKDFLISELLANPEQILVLPNAYDDTVFRTDLEKAAARKLCEFPNDVFIVGYIGKFTTMGKSKGVENLIDAIRLLNDRQYMLLLVGDDKALLPPHGDVNVTVVPHIPQSSLPPYLRSCDVVTMPFPRMPHYEKYMSPMKLFEYMASGVPIISTDLPSVREIVGDKDVLYIKNDSPEEIAKAVTMLKKNPAKGEALAVSSLEKSRNFTWNARAEAFFSFLSKT